MRCTALSTVVRVPFHAGRTGRYQADCEDKGEIQRGMGLAILATLEKASLRRLKISLPRPITPQTGLITAEGVMSRGRRIGTAEGRITDGQGRLLVHGTTTCLIFPG